MRDRLLRRSLFSFLLLFFVVSTSSAKELVDQLWLQQKVKVGIDDFNIHYKFENRYACATDEFVLGYNELGLKYRLLNDWSLTAAYRLMKHNKEEAVYENRPIISAKYKHKFNDLAISNRFQTDFRLFKDSNKSRYRNKLQLDYSYSLFNLKADVYTYYEALYSFSDEQFSQTRFSLGSSISTTNWLNVTVFYMNQQHWIASGNSYMLGCYLAIQI